MKVWWTLLWKLLRLATCREGWSRYGYNYTSSLSFIFNLASYKVVARLSQGDHKVVTTLWFLYIWVVLHGTLEFVRAYFDLLCVVSWRPLLAVWLDREELWRVHSSVQVRRRRPGSGCYGGKRQTGRVSASHGTCQGQKSCYLFCRFS